MAKKLKSFRFSEEVISALQKLCAKNLRSETNMIEILILEAAKKAKL